MSHFVGNPRQVFSRVEAQLYSYPIFHTANCKDADQTMLMHRLICACVVRIQKHRTKTDVIYLAIVFVKETKSATMNIFRFFLFLFK